MSRKILKRLDIYIIKKFLGTYLLAIALIISIAVVFDYSEKMDRLTSNETPWSAIVFDFYLNFIPYFANLFSALFVFIAVIFFTSKLAENSEIIAMFSAGMSFRRLMLPYMITAAIIALSTYVLGSYVIPKGSIMRINFEDKYYKKRKESTARNVQLEVDTGVIAYIERFEDYSKIGYRFSLDKFEDKKLVSHLTARSITYDTTAVYKWILKDYMIREFSGYKETIRRGDRMDSIIMMEPSDFLIMKKQQEMLTGTQLSNYIDKQKKRGFGNVKEFEIEYHKRIAMSFASFILTTIGLCISSKKIKGGMGLHLGIGLALSFSYILFQTISSTFAVNGNMPPVMAVWIPNILYALIAGCLYWRAARQ
ncbi:YjgP/YjgQ family permease [termite gut metagenome]|uniref:YjgP/YjgQ family permease n=1 Tax=termite gut metagenome TaxID=433724 RepID=A0A5J4QXX1_9ZZZZ